MGNKEELQASRDMSATVLLLKLVETLEKGLEETQEIGNEFKDKAVSLGTTLRSIGSLSADPVARKRLVDMCNILEKHLSKYKHPKPRLIKKDLAKIRQALNFAAGEHWGLYQLTILMESIEGMKKVNLLPNMTSIPETLSNSIKSLGSKMQNIGEDKK
ncbi:MAG: hypothetical protein GF353_28565 [Candidatus Lokiarchaeota archaeon]|nr:hypothetical protein [Candidatus Lokiarchaeota archaeon]MBD3353956.1 hypothetical protein [Candidatus Lokiarchaeota archaeon]